MSVAACAEPMPGKEYAKFDPALSNNLACKRLYLEGTDLERTELVTRFCGAPRFKDAIPERCKCYRFRDTPDYQKYKSLWQDLVEPGKGDSPIYGHYTCMYEGCTADPHAYTTAAMRDFVCPDFVYCKQTVGDVSVNRKKVDLDDLRGKDPEQVKVIMEQRCGRKSDTPDEPDEPDEPETPAPLDNRLMVGGAIVGGVLLLLAVVLLLRG